MKLIMQTRYLALSIACAVLALPEPAGAQFSTPYELIKAIEDQKYEKVREMMLDCRCPNTRTAQGVPALVLAARDRSMKIVEYLLNSGANPNVKARNSRMTALMEFARRDNVAGVELMLENGANVNAADSSGETALMYAVSARAQRAVRVLLAKGADPQLANYQGQTPMDMARSRRYRRIETLLADAPAG